MRCNCKKKVDKINEKFGDGGKDSENEFFLLKVLRFIIQMLFGILCGLLIIVMAVPMLLYVIICMMFGKEPTFRIRNLKNY